MLKLLCVKGLKNLIKINKPFSNVHGESSKNAEPLAKFKWTFQSLNAFIQTNSWSREKSLRSGVEGLNFQLK
jgi:hypothetical protein